MASVGEPLNPEAVAWGVEAFGKPFHDNWWQTETGGIMIANYPSMDVKPGSMGGRSPGSRPASSSALEAGRFGKSHSRWPSESLRCGPAGLR